MFRWFDPSMTIALTVRGVTLVHLIRETAQVVRRSVILLAMCVPFLAASRTDAQVAEDKPVPILSGSIGTFSFVTAGQNAINTQVNPVLLVPLGDRWLIESRAEFEGEFQRPPGGGPYGGPVDKHVRISR